MFLIVLLKRETFSLTERSSNALSQEKSVIAFFHSIRVRVLVMPDFPLIWWRIVNLKVTFCINYLMMAIWM